METMTNETNELKSEFLRLLPCQRSAEVLVKNCLLFLLVSNLLITGAVETNEAAEFRSRFFRVLLSRRLGQVPLVAECSKPVEDPVFQSDVPSTAALESCPKEPIENLKDMLKEENIHLHTEAGEQRRLPLLILSLKEKKREERRPAVVFMHGTNANKEWLRPWLEAYASRGYVAIGLDSRYHGERADSKTAYQDALISSWKNGNTMPFIFDTVWDLIKLADYLTQREDIDPQRIGITGISLGGMHAWFAAAIDTRYSVAAPLIGVQGFRWAIDNDAWQARVNSLKPVFEEARNDMGKSEIDKEVVKKVWDRIAPGLAFRLDAPYSLPVIAPRPLYLLNGAEDPRCPLGGLVVPLQKTKKAYKITASPGNFKFVAEDGVGHTVTSFMIKESSDWFDKFLKQGNMSSE
ncbi:AB hydrolase-1 domain-containing protein [Hirschfeldia incana]|nr:AB hydrolase-1 domain-containing protein [Hirschfeldia incana]